MKTGAGRPSYLLFAGSEEEDDEDQQHNAAQAHDEEREVGHHGDDQQQLVDPRRGGVVNHHALRITRQRERYIMARELFIYLLLVAGFSIQNIPLPEVSP